MHIPALPLYQIRLSAKIPQSAAYPKTMKTLADHLRKRRLDLKLYQKDVAQIIGVDTMTVCNWENNRGPAINMIPKIIQFLGYDPFTTKLNTLGEKIKLCRRLHGLSQKKLAKNLRIDPTTLARWERGASEPGAKLRNRLSEFMNDFP